MVLPEGQLQFNGFKCIGSVLKKKLFFFFIVVAYFKNIFKGSKLLNLRGKNC